MTDTWNWNEEPSLRWLARKKLQVSFDYLKMLVDDCRGTKAPYYFFCKNKRGGGERVISVPLPHLKELQEGINRNILEKIPVHSSVFGFSGGNVYDALFPHKEARQIMTVDIQDAFHSVHKNDIVEFFNPCYWMDYRFDNKLPKNFFSRTVAEILADLMTFSVNKVRILPQGAPTSPKIFDLVCWPLDKELGVLSEKRNSIYTRFADNIIISTQESFFPKGTVRAIQSKIRGHSRYGPKFTPHKLRIRKITESCGIKVLGLNLMGGKILPTRSYQRHIRKEIHHIRWLIKHGLPFWHEWSVLSGRMGFICYTHLSESLLKDFTDLKEEVQSCRG